MIRCRGGRQATSPDLKTGRSTCYNWGNCNVVVKKPGCKYETSLSSIAQPLLKHTYCVHDTSQVTVKVCSRLIKKEDSCTLLISRVWSRMPLTSLTLILSLGPLSTALSTSLLGSKQRSQVLRIVCWQAVPQTNYSNLFNASKSGWLKCVPIHPGLFLYNQIPILHYSCLGKCEQSSSS